jgi:hypothetical protein
MFGGNTAPRHSLIRPYVQVVAAHDPETGGNYCKTIRQGGDILNSCTSHSLVHYTLEFQKSAEADGSADHSYCMAACSDAPLILRSITGLWAEQSGSRGNGRQWLRADEPRRWDLLVSTSRVLRNWSAPHHQQGMAPHIHECINLRSLSVKDSDTILCTGQAQPASMCHIQATVSLRHLIHDMGSQSMRQGSVGAGGRMVAWSHSIPDAVWAAAVRRRHQPGPDPRRQRHARCTCCRIPNPAIRFPRSQRFHLQVTSPLQSTRSHLSHLLFVQFPTRQQSPFVKILRWIGTAG